VLLAQLLETDDCVLSLAVTPDRKKLAAGGCDRLVHVWQLGESPTTANLDQTIDIHSDWVLGLAFSPNGSRLLTASRDKTAKVWDLNKRETVQSFAEHQQPVFSVAMQANGQAGLSVGGDHMLRIWNADGTAKAIKTVSGHSEEVTRIVPVPGQLLFITASADATVRVWTADGNPVRTLGGFSDQVYAVAVSPDGARVAAGGWDGMVRVWNLADGAMLAAFSASPGHVPKSTAQK
jgi:WD40 repeat protein